MVRDIKGTKKSFYRYVRSKRKTKENMGLSLNGVKQLRTENVEMPEVFNFSPSPPTSGFTKKMCPVSNKDKEIRNLVQGKQLEIT